MKKYVVITTVMVLFIALLSACGSGGNGVTERWTVTFDKNGGDTEASPRQKVVTPPATTVDALPAEPTRDGYIFNGWNTDRNGEGDEFTATTPVTASLTVYAQWNQVQAGSHIVTFDKNGGDTEASPRQKVVTPPDTTIDELPPTAPTREGYIFAGWYTVPEASGGIEFTAETPVTESFTVYARWTVIVTYTVTFDKNGGDTEASPNTKTVSTPATTVDALPAEPTRGGYIFNGWNTDRNGEGDEFTATTFVTGSLTVYAQWVQLQAGSHTVTFDKNGGDTEASPRQKVVTPPDTTIDELPSTAPTREGYTFAGWYTVSGTSGGSEFTAATTVTNSLSVYARWTAITYTVTFNKNEGDTEANPTTKTVTYPATTIDALPTAPTRAYHTFEGWYTVSTSTGGSQFTADTYVTESFTVYARWVPAAHAVTFHKNTPAYVTDSTDASPSSAEGGANGVTVPTTNPTYGPTWGAGVSFGGWYTEPACTNLFNASTPVTEPVNVYAKWVFTPGTPTVVGNTWVHDAPTMGTNSANANGQGNWSGTVNADGSVTYSGGAIRYQFPDGYTNYDYFTLEYVAAASYSSNVVKQLNNGTDYLQRSGAQNSQYPTLNTSGSLEFNVSGAGSTGGIAIQHNGGGTKTIKFTKVTFMRLPRYTITFDANGGTLSTSSMEVIGGNAIGTMPTPTKQDYNFDGWFTATTGGTKYTSSSTMPNNNLDLYAQWKIAPPPPAGSLAPIIVAFNTASVEQFPSNSTSATTTITADTLTFTTPNNNSGNRLGFAFKVDTESEFLANYDKIVFTLGTTSQGNSQNRKLNLTAGTSKPTAFIDPGTNASSFITTYTGASNNIGSTFPTTMIFTIDKSKVATLKGEIWIGVYINCDNGANYSISNFKIVQNFKLDPADPKVDFTKVLFAKVGTPTFDSSTNTTTTSYTYALTNYSQGIPFIIDIGTAKLSDYSGIKFTVSGSGNDFNNKPCNVAGSLSQITSYVQPGTSNAAFVTTYINTPSNNITGLSSSSATQQMTFSIDQSKAISMSLTGEIWLAVFIHAGNGQTYTISNFELVP